MSSRGEAVLPPVATSQLDLELLGRTLELAELGRPAARPNPVVGCVIARSDGTVLATGYHRVCGEHHAERDALEAMPSGALPPDATVYVSLEPCAHHGRQPPCAHALLARGARRVAIASPDADPVTCGRGPALLAAAGVELVRAPAALARRALQQNAGFVSRNLRGRPYVTWKWAMTRDGRLDTADPQRRWISSPAAREHAHYLRAGAGGVAVGIGTVLADDPLLTVRGPIAARVHIPPVRVVFDRTLRLPLHAHLASRSADAPVLVVCAHDADPKRAAELRDAGVEVWRDSDGGGLRGCLEMLAGRGIGDLLLESGPTLATSLHDAGLVDALHCWIAPYEAPAGRAILARDHPLHCAILAATANAAADGEQERVALVHPAWTFAGLPDGWT